MPAPGLAARKEELRRSARLLPRTDRVARARAAVANLLALQELAAAGSVALYAAIQDEVPLDPVFAELRRRGCRTAAPRVVAGRLELIDLLQADAWVLGYRGIREPAPTGPRIAVAEIDLFVVPGLLFDRDLRRLGRGGGHYDRLLAAARPDACRVGICYADRVVPDLPVDSQDVPMHMLVTEREVIRRKGISSSGRETG